jgi:hypothetical protein
VVGDPGSPVMRGAEDVLASVNGSVGVAESRSTIPENSIRLQGCRGRGPRRLDQRLESTVEAIAKRVENRLLDVEGRNPHN